MISTTKTIDLGQGVTLEMVLIPSGTFMMGSPENEPNRLEDEGPQHQVTLSAFFMGRYPVTQAQWRVVAGLPQVKRELDPDPSRFKGDDRPVEGVSWYDAMEFCARLSALTGREYRLPSEAQWEYACRADTTTAFHSGQTLDKSQANFMGHEITVVGSFPPNGFGLHDMQGNVWEWCLDHYHDSYNGAPTDGSAWVTGGDSDLRILRGGSWYSDPRFCRCAYRYNDNPDYRYLNYGFRVVSL